MALILCVVVAASLPVSTFADGAAAADTGIAAASGAKKTEESSKKKKSNLEAEVFAIMEKSLKTALDVALDDIMKEWK